LSLQTVRITMAWQYLPVQLHSIFHGLHVGVIQYYDKQEHFFDDDKDCLGEISLYSVFSVVSSKDDTTPAGTTFDVNAYVTRGGDASGVRTFTLQATDVQGCSSWMEGTFVLSNCKIALKQRLCCS
jgi:hypothetical protein